MLLLYSTFLLQKGAVSTSREKSCVPDGAAFTPGRRNKNHVTELPT